MDALPKHIIKFDSKLEFTVYQKLRKYIPEAQIKLQQNITLKAATEFSETLNFVIDFAVLYKDGEPEFYVEAKGILTKDAALKFKILEIIDPIVRSKIIIASVSRNYYFGKKYPPSTTLAELELFLGNKYGTRIN